MPTVGIGARELRVHFQGERRLLYVASFPEAVYVLHVFEKKSRKTRSDDLAVARARYIELLAMRRKKHATKSRP
jgi:phage-related protein